MASPVKRRALAPLDANATVSSPLPAKNSFAGSKPLLRGVEAAPVSPMQSVGEALRMSAPAPVPTSEQPSLKAQKRPLPQDGPGDKGRPTTSTPKKVCLNAHVPAGDTCSVGSMSAPTSAARRHCSISPSSSSVFDNSGIVDTSQTTNITEPDIQAIRPTRPHTLTREQSRRRAEILKLRLGLARYKLCTGQVSVPLDQLRVVPSIAQLTRSQSLNGHSSKSRTQSRPRTLMPMSPKTEQAAHQNKEQVHPQLPRRQWTAWGRSRGLASGMGETAAYSDSSSDEEDFFDVHRGVRHPNLIAVPLLRKQTSSQNEFDHIDRIEDSDGQRSEDNDNDKDTIADNKSKVEVDEDVHGKCSGGVVQHRGVLGGNASSGLLNVSS